MTFGSLFAGIGGFDLGLERAGMLCRWQVEIDPFCRAVLAKHWPEVPRYDDVRTVGVDTLERVDVLCGGFPCQDISHAGKRVGMAGERSGLWSEYARLIGELRPRYVLVENVTALLGRGLGAVLGDLAAIGFDAEWDCIPASAIGAPHRRDRVWLLAYPNGTRLEGWERAGVSERAHERPFGARGAYVSDTHDQGQSGIAFHDGARRSLSAFARAHEWWRIEPDVGRVAHGVPNRVDRLRSLGNAIVPQIAEWIGRRVIAHGAM